MQAGDKGEADRHLGQKVAVRWPDPVHVNITGGGGRHVNRNPEAARRFPEFLSSKQAQGGYAAANHESPLESMGRRPRAQVLETLHRGQGIGCAPWRTQRACRGTDGSQGLELRRPVTIHTDRGLSPFAGFDQPTPFYGSRSVLPDSRPIEQQPIPRRARPDRPGDRMASMGRMAETEERSTVVQKPELRSLNLRTDCHASASAVTRPWTHHQGFWPGVRRSHNTPETIQCPKQEQRKTR